MDCFCSNSALTNDHKVGITNCDTTCIGDLSKTCGGKDRIQIYNLISLYNLYRKIIFIILYILYISTYLYRTKK